MSAEIVTYARKELLQEYLALGWEPRGSPIGAPHVIRMEWPHDETSTPAFPAAIRRNKKDAG